MVRGPQSLCHRIQLGVGCLFDRLPLNRVIAEQTPAGLLYRKTRRWYGDWLIQASNLLDTPFIILAQPDWYAREQAIHRQVYGEDIRIDANGYLVMHARPGEQLATFLDNPNHDQQAKFQSLARAIEALWNLHQRILGEQSGEYRLFSHADAIVGNVTYDQTTDTASWFDFETTHRVDCPLAWRRADDLRALSYSAAAHLPMLAVAHLAELVVSTYPDQHALYELAGIARTLQACPGVIHLGQTHIDYDRSQIVNQVFLQVTPG